MKNKMLSNWQRLKLGEVCDFFNGKAHEKYIDKKGKYVVVNSKFISSDGNEYKKTNKNLFPLFRNDVVMVMSDVPNGKALAKCFVINKDNIYTLNQRICAFRTNKFETRFLYHQLNRNAYLLNFDTGDKQTNLRKNEILKCPLLVPPLSEQKRIVDKIDKVHLLQEKSDVEIKEVEKLISSVCSQEFERKEGIKKAQSLGDLCNIIKGKFPTLKTPKGKYTFVVTAEERKTANRYQFDDEAAVCIPLVSSTGHGHASMHRIHYEKGKFALANIMAALIPKDKSLLTKYLYYYLSFKKDNLLVPLMRGGANVTIPFNELFDVKVSIPNIERQKKLVSVLIKAEELKEKSLEKQRLVNQLFQSTLNYAFQGKL